MAIKKGSAKDKEPKLSHSERALLSEKQKKFDPKATADDCVKDIRRLQEINPLKHITRNFYRHHGGYSDATWGQFYGTFLEFRRQAGLELSRNQHSIERKVAKHASLDVYRNFYDSEVLPYHQKYEKKVGGSRWKTILSGSDFHDVDSDRFVLSTFIDVAKRVQPDVIILNGDLWDNYEFSRFDKDPRQIKILDRFNFVKTNILGEIRRVCQNSQIDLVAGNHEARILKLLSDKTPALKVLLSDVMGLSLSDCFGLDEFEINLVCKLDLAAFTNPDIAADVKENFKVYYDTFVASHYKNLQFGLCGTSGHTHRPETVTFANIPMGKLTWVTTGSIAKTRVEYMESMESAQNSFMMAHIDTVTKSVASEHFIIPKDHVIIHGQRYVRA